MMMEMPMPCSKCGEWIELNDSRRSPLRQYEDSMLCRECYNEHERVFEMKTQIEDIELDLDNDTEYTKGNRRELKKTIKKLKSELSTMGYEYEDLIY